MSWAIKRSNIFEQISKSERKEMFQTAEERIKSKAQIDTTTLKEPFCDGAEEFAIVYRDDITWPKIEYSARKIVLPFSDDPEETDKYLKQLNN